MAEQIETVLDVSDLVKEADYWFRYRVRDNSTGLTSASSPDCCRRKRIAKRAPLILPNRPRITEIDDRTIRLSWTSTTVRGVDELSYIVEKCEGGTSEWIQVSKGLSDNSIVIRDLEPTKSYSFRIKIETEYGISEASTEVVLKHRKYGTDKMDVGRKLLLPGTNLEPGAFFYFLLIFKFCSFFFLLKLQYLPVQSCRNHWLMTWPVLEW